MGKEKLEPLCFSRIWDYCQRECPFYKEAQEIAEGSSHFIEQVVETQNEAARLHKADKLARCGVRK